MSRVQFPAVPGGSSARGTFAEIENGPLKYQHNNALIAVCGGFFVYLLVPKGMKRRLCSAYPRRFARTEANKLPATQDVSTTIRTILPFAKNALKDTRLAWEADKACMTTSPSEANSNVFLKYEYGKECLLASQFLYHSESTSRTGIKSSRRSSGECSSMHSSPARLFSNNKPRNYGSTNVTDVQLLVSSSGQNALDQSTNNSMSQSDTYGVNNSKKLLVLISRGCLDEAKESQQAEALDLLRIRKVPFEVIDGMDPIQRARYVRLRISCRQLLQTPGCILFLTVLTAPYLQILKATRTL